MTAQNSVSEKGKGGRCALPEAQELELVGLIGTKTMVELAKQFGVHRNTVKNIKDRYVGVAPPNPSTVTGPQTNPPLARLPNCSTEREPDQSQEAL